MDALAQVLTALFAGGALVGILAYFKRKPGQRERDAVEVAEGEANIAKANLNVAKGTFEMVTTELEDQFKRMAAELREVREQHAADMSALRKEFVQYRADAEALLAQRAAEARAARAGEVEAIRKADLYAGENADLRERVDVLEAEVRALKNGLSPDLS